MMDKEIREKILEWKHILTNDAIHNKSFYDTKLNSISFVVMRQNELRFEVRTDEQHHNKPHIHVSTSAASLSIAIETGEILAKSGSIRERNIEKARDWIFKNQNFLKEKWNELANCPIKFPI